MHLENWAGRPGEKGEASQSPKIITRNLSPLAILGSQMSENVSGIIWPNTFILQVKKLVSRKKTYIELFSLFK